jgi:hypothetical protein
MPEKNYLHQRDNFLDERPKVIPFFLQEEGKRESGLRDIKRSSDEEKSDSFCGP